MEREEWRGSKKYRFSEEESEEEKNNTTGLREKRENIGKKGKT